jgi:integrase/recombinase XerC
MIDAFLAWMRAERGASPHTLRAYGTDLAGLAAHVDGKAPEALEVADLRAWLATTTASPASLQRRIATVRTFYRWLQRDGRIAESPAERLRAPRVPRGLPRTVEIEEATPIVETPVGEGVRANRNRALLELAYGGGLRVSELAALDVGDLDLVEGTVRIRRGKGGKERIVPIGPPAIDAVRAWLGPREVRAGDPVFVSDGGRRLTTRALYDVVRRAGLQQGRHLHPHMLRHSFATHLLAGGADVRAIQEMMGHESLATTQRYTAVDAEQLGRTHRAAHPRARASR